MMKLTCAILLLALSVNLVASVATRRDCVYTDYRLPQHIRPEHYDLKLDVDTDEFKFKGTVDISLRVNVARSWRNPLGNIVIVLHANETLSIDDVQFRYNNKEVKIKNICRFEENELLVITLDKKLIFDSRGELTIKFHGDISNDPDYLMGFYKNVYHTSDGKEKAIASTQFEASSARKAFPCFDEPAFKATFDITITHDPKMVALSNGAIVSEQIDSTTNRKVTKYKRTPLMSTYLVAYAIGELEHIERVISDGRITIRAFTVPGRIDEARFALDTAVRAVGLMEEYFDIPYAMDKIDMVALPSFDAGAMENWGLILYLDSSFLHHQTNSGSWKKGVVTSTVVHELAHQWFGNLVTMKWWNDLWLNEGFATWFQDYTTDRLFPEFEWDQHYLISEHIYALETDSKVDVESCQPEEVGRDLDEAFSDIVYLKTEAIIRFIHDDYLGPERFKEGIRKYISDHKYGNTEAGDLWSALKATSGLPVDDLMRSWITQPGHPEVRVQLVNTGSRVVLRLTQKRFLKDQELSDELKAKVATQNWFIPISLIVADDKGNSNRIRVDMRSRETQVELPNWFKANSPDHWVKLNAGFKGFYRVHYPKELLKRLEKPFRSKTLETSDRLNIIFDTIHSSNYDSLTGEELADIITWSEGDQEGSIKLLQYKALQDIRKDRLSKKTSEKIREYFQISDVHTYERFGFKLDLSETSQSDKEALTEAFNRLARGNYKPLVRDALREFDEVADKGSVDRRLAMYYCVMSSGSPDQVNRLRKLRDGSKHEDEIARIDRVLREFKEENVIAKV